MSDTQVDPARLRPAVAPGADLLAILRRQWLTVVVGVLVGTIGAWLYSTVQSTDYESRSTLLLVAASGEQSPGGGRERSLDVETWATVARSTGVLQSVATEMGLDLTDVRKRTTATAAPTGDVLVLTFEAADRELAIEGATTYSERFLETRDTNINAATIQLKNRLEDLVDDLNQQIDDLSARIAEIEGADQPGSDRPQAVLIATQQLAIERLGSVTNELAGLDTNAETGRVLIDPRTAVAQTGLGRPLLLLSGCLVGGLLGLILALLRDRYDDRYQSAAAPELLGLKEIARVPYVDNRAAGADAQQAYSRLVARLSFTRRGQSETGRAILLLPVESRTLPTSAATSVAAELEASGRSTGAVIEQWMAGEHDGDNRLIWDRVEASLNRMRAANDLVLVAQPALDQSAVGLGVAAFVDETLLLVSQDTPVTLIQHAVDDLVAVEVEQPQIVVIENARRRPFSLADVRLRQGAMTVGS